MNKSKVENGEDKVRAISTSVEYTAHDTITNHKIRNLKVKTFDPFKVENGEDKTVENSKLTTADREEVRGILKSFSNVHELNCDSCKNTNMDKWVEKLIKVYDKYLRVYEK